MSKLTNLFQPIWIGSLKLPNRIVMTAVTTGYEREENDRFANFYVERVRGGVGLVIIGNLLAIHTTQTIYHRLLNTITSDSDIPRLQRWTTAIHDNGGMVAAMISPGYGFWSKGGEGATTERVSPSGVVLHGKEVFEDHPENSPTRPLTVEEIHMLVEILGDAAERALQTGFDAIEIQAVGGNLLNRFLSTATNKRTDEYGGSVENRARFLLETINCIKKRVGDNLPLICRISGLDMVPQGLVLDDYKEIASLIESAGIHAINIMPGWHISRKPRHNMCVPPGAFAHLAEGIKQVVNIPVVTNVQIHDPLLAEQILAEGKADIIGMCRPLIADPKLPIKAKEGRLEEIRLCTHCETCFSTMVEEGSMVCSVNARVGREREYTITPAEKSKKVFVIGGGPAGMEAARVAALRGHRVTLLEKKDRLGGRLLEAVLPPYKEGWNRLIKYLTTQMDKLSVNVRFNEEETVKVVEEGKPDAVIVATGALPIIPNIPGVNGKNVVTAIDVLTGQKEVDQNVVVVGGGLIGCETAEFLYRKGKQVSILEMLPDIGIDINSYNRWVVLDRLTEAGIRMETNAKVERITEKGVTFNQNDSSKFIKADSVVIAVGMIANDHIVEELKDVVASLHKVGDCVQPRKVKDTIEEGFQVGLKV